MFEPIYKIFRKGDDIPPRPLVVHYIDDAGYMGIRVIDGTGKDITQEDKDTMNNYNAIKKMKYLGMLRQEQVKQCTHKSGKYNLWVDSDGFCDDCREVVK